MTEIQIYALIGFIIAVGLLFWFGYKIGRSDGLAVGIAEGQNIERADGTEKLHELNLRLEQALQHHKQLWGRYTRALAASKLGEPDRQILLDIAEKLRIAAATFSALRTGKKIEHDTLALRDQALAMADLLEPVTQEDAA
ncbi:MULTISPECIES: hypothetical protein [Pseudomonas]|uniref:hypothetical protein n=1 Tax=Pseudomonas TaxID=286 RepID=UPI000B363483|nr:MULTISPECIES: hypothetical protein [Pseudomonas]PMY56125.1 hypothetical protein C1X70_02705 [Pseudomonas sp. FW305-53]PMY88992.1 hypothetical protein C1X68_01325 [Pseudomonas sp. FW303-C2]PMY92173.1 hypothetical protein C1X67_15020 [Pseudomonas sp. FW305-62]PNA46246.1 hypothetical protein C1X71_02005 [Pseudomonas sp. FW306-2-2C-A10BC]PNA89049.1 hypothetical protein C1X66_02505 [Pseudomonas sp. MPR-R3B]